MKSTFSFLGLFLATLLITMPSFAALQVTATVSDNNVVLGDRFMLTVNINDNDDDYQLDTSELEKSFHTSRPSRSQSNEYINGKFSQKTQWQLSLQAKEIGLFTIPAFKIGDHNTQPIAIKVTLATKQSQNDSADDRTVFIENSINKQSVYLGQSFIFTTKLYISKNSNQLELDAPYFAGAEISVLGQDKNKQTVINGIRYNTITRQYKINATQAGQFEINSPLLSGTLRKVVAISDWQNSVVAESINARGKRLKITVKAIPNDYQGVWIVSEDLHLIENNDLTAQSYKVGEPITRSITLQIASVSKDKLPNITLNYPKSLRMYPDQDQLQEGQANGINYGVRIIRHAIIAEKEGLLILPEIRLNWFNSRTNQQQTAILAEQSLTILAADQQPLAMSPKQQPEVTQSQTTIIVDNSSLIYWKVAVAVLVITNLLMLFYLLSLRRLQKNNQQQQTTTIPPLDHHYLTLQSCFNTNNATACYKALLSYAQHQYPTLKSLGELADKSALEKQTKQQLKDEIQWLQICCSDHSQHWDANKLSALIKKHEAIKVAHTNQDPMNLNP